MAVSEVLSLAIESGSAGTTVRLRGEVDLATAPKLRECLASLTGDVVVELSDVTFLDSQAVGLLIAEHKRRETIGVRLTVRGASSMALRTFELTGADQLFNLEDEPLTKPAA
jgi:anti-sigma B factor antagonist